jgi:hypothetical protein
MAMKANLHLHSRHSDGTLWPREMARNARDAGIEAAALSDHDTLGGTSEFLASCAEFGIRAYIACEIDVVAPEIGYNSELLAYFPRGDTHRTLHFLRNVSVKRYDRMKYFIERFKELLECKDLSFEELLAIKLGDRVDAFDPEDISLNKVDIYNYLKTKNALERAYPYREFKRKFFDSSLVSDAKLSKATVAELIPIIRADGGLVVIPHIGHEFSDSENEMRARVETLRAMLSWFRTTGVSGIELYYYRNRDRDGINTLIKDLADEFGFFTTYGSDCHGPGSGKYTIEDFSGDFPGFPESA